jgi:hypothetical protein
MAAMASLRLKYSRALEVMATMETDVASFRSSAGRALSEKDALIAILSEEVY